MANKVNNHNWQYYDKDNKLHTLSDEQHVKFMT